MTSFPIFISLEGKPCLIVGGGNVAARKCRGLLAFGADVTVIAKKVGLTADLHNTDKVTGHERASTRLHMTERSFRERDVTEKEWTLVIAATDDREVNSRVARLCHERNIPVNVADCRGHYHIGEVAGDGFRPAKEAGSSIARMDRRNQKD